LLFSRSSSVNDMDSLGCCLKAPALAGACLDTFITTELGGNHFFVTKRYFLCLLM